MPFGVYGLPTTTNHPDDTYEFEEEASTPSAFPYDICVNVVDVWGCEADICGELVIDGAADVTFTHAPLVCGQNSTVLTANFDFGNSSSGLDHFELYATVKAIYWQHQTLIHPISRLPTFLPIIVL